MSVHLKWFSHEQHIVDSFSLTTLVFLVFLEPFVFITEVLRFRSIILLFFSCFHLFSFLCFPFTPSFKLFDYFLVFNFSLSIEALTYLFFWGFYYIFLWIFSGYAGGYDIYPLFFSLFELILCYFKRNTKTSPLYMSLYSSL